MRKKPWIIDEFTYEPGDDQLVHCRELVDSILSFGSDIGIYHEGKNGYLGCKYDVLEDDRLVLSSLEGTPWVLSTVIFRHLSV